jgi:hypothetical protein
MTSHRLKDFSPLNDPDQYDNNCDHKQNMDEPTHRVTAHQPECPQNYQYYSDRPQHMIRPSLTAVGSSVSQRRLKRLTESIKHAGADRQIT